MAKQFCENSIYRTLYDQQTDSTWTDKDYKNHITNGNILEVFKRDGCALCSLAMHRGEHPLDTMAAGACSSSSPYVKDWLGLSKQTTDIYAEIARNILVYENPVAVEVPGHFVLANAFAGVIDVDADGNPYGTGATAQMIKILDPWKGRYSTLQQVEAHYGKASSIRK